MTCTECGSSSIYALSMCSSCCEAAGCFEPTDPEDAFEQAYEDHLDAMFDDAFGTPPGLPERDLPLEDAYWRPEFTCREQWALRHPNAIQRRSARRNDIPF